MLPGGDIRQLGIVAAPEGLAHQQVQPNGVDLSLDQLWRVVEPGALGVADVDRHLPERAPVPFGDDGWATLAPGAYVARFAETVSMPTDRAGLAFPRSSLLRMGVHVPTAVWDAGYSGRGETVLVVASPHGVRLQRGARIAQLVVFQLTRETEGYTGRYQEAAG